MRVAPLASPTPHAVLSAFAPAGPEAATLLGLFWLMAIGATVVWVAVLAIAWLAARRDRQPLRHARWLILAGGVIVPTLVLTALLGHGLWLMPRVRAAVPDDALRVSVSGEQWWWRVHYAAAGVETGVGPFGNVGLSLSYLAGKDGKKRSDNELSSGQYEGGIYFRGGVGPIKAFARGTVGMLNFDGERFFTANVNGTDIRREAKGEWKGRLFSGMVGASYDARFGGLSVRPTVSLEHFSLKEKGYTETGDSDAFNLTVGSRRSSETAAVATLAASLLLYAAAFQFPDGVQVISAGALRGLKDTRVPMFLAAFAYWGVGMSLGAGLGLGLGWGPRGMWTGLIAGLVVASVLMAARFAWSLSRLPSADALPAAPVATPTSGA